MYISQDAVHRAFADLENVQPFYGITFLVCKHNKLPIGRTIEFQISHLEAEFLEIHFKPIVNTTYFFRVFRPSEKEKFWLKSDYANSGSQSNRTQKFGEAFIHPKRSNLWGWSENYIDVLANNLQNGNKIPFYSLAIWLYRDHNWIETKLSLEAIKELFYTEFNISEEEVVLFDFDIPIEYRGNNLLSPDGFNWGVFRNFFSIPAPVDAPAEKVKSLQSITIENVGPANAFQLFF
ncbi:hypothetical protein [Fibrella aestuarina]|uniref:hypothetical protein n=1 Tax=Fibrella aestuarina TaxID=651143 RepID=UPI00059BA71D|nr:hypothetical protein [Fibrella aestuarina]